MSIQTMKKKITNSSSGISISGSSPGGIWVSRNSKYPIHKNNNGFSINGGHCNIGCVGNGWLVSKTFTPYRGIYPKGYGGCCGNYYDKNNVFITNEVNTRGTEDLFIKPSVLSNKGMLELKYRQMINGQFPCNVVSPQGNQNLMNNTNELYTHTKMSSNMCVVRSSLSPNDDEIIYPSFGNCKAECKVSVSYPQTPYDNESYATIIQKKCANPELWQRPFPPSKNGNLLRAINLQKI